jgi:predicted thioesterase
VAVLTPSQSSMVTETLRVSLASAASDVDESALSSLAAAAAALAPATSHPPHEAWPALGASVQRPLIVTADDTAAAMGHPDADVAVLGSPRLALWFELVTCDLLPAPSADLSHVGVGILVHHLGRADVGETVNVEASCASVSGRRAVFTCRASVGDRLVGIGAHHRALLVSR